MRERKIYILSLLFAVLFSLNSLAQSVQTDRPQDSILSGQLRPFFNKEIHDTPLVAEVETDLASYFSKLETIRKRKKTDLDFLRSVFFKTHRKYLRHYDASATLKETMTTGVYGCLTGTALYSIILSHFGYENEIIELSSHVYLKVRLNDRVILIESTLPDTGFLENVSAIAKATEQYQDNSRKLSSIDAIAGINEGKAKGAYERSISLKQLSGLQYYNMAIYDIRGESLEKAFANAMEAIEFYPSKRTEQLMEIVINKILQSKNLTKDLKSGILNTYVTQIRKKKLTQR